MTDRFRNPWEIPAFAVVPRPGGLLGLDAFSPGWRDARDAAIDDVVERVRAIFAPVDVEVSTRRSLLDGYIEVVIGGSDLDRGAAEGCDRWLGFASLLCSSLRRDERRVAHVLSECIGESSDHDFGQRMRAEVIAHEVGRALGHVDDSGSITFPSGLGTDRWGAGTVVHDGADMSGDGCGRATQDCTAVRTSPLRGHGDAHGDFAEERFSVVIDPDAPAAACP